MVEHFYWVTMELKENRAPRTVIQKRIKAEDALDATVKMVERMPKAHLPKQILKLTAEKA